MLHERFKALVLAAIDNITPVGEQFAGADLRVDQPVGDWLDDLEDAIHQKLIPKEVEEDCGSAEDDDSANVPEPIAEEDT